MRDVRQEFAERANGSQPHTALIDLEAVGGVDAERLARGLELHSERTGHGRYRVTGGNQEHWVDLYTSAHPRCDCGDHLWREQACKHILAALLREGDARVVSALARLALAWRETHALSHRSGYRGRRRQR